MMSETVIVVGAGSAIAQALCRVLASRGCPLVLAARNIEEIEPFASDLRIRHRVSVEIIKFEALEFDRYPEFVESCMKNCRDQFTGVVICHGYLPHLEDAGTDQTEVARTIDVNFKSPAMLLEHFSRHLAASGRGYLAAISSVAGDRGRQSNYLYGASKGGLSVFLQGLRNRLFHSGLHVLTIKPGFVDTPMTQGLIRSNSPLVATPERVALYIDRAIRKRKNVVYIPWFWWPIMTIISLIPESLFKRMKM